MPRLNIDHQRYNDAKTTAEPRKFEPIPEGVYTAIIEETGILSNKAGTGEYMKIKWRIIDDGPYAKRIIWDNITTSHRDERSSKMGMEFLHRLCDAIGIDGIPEATEQLHNRPCAIKVIIRTQDGYPPDNKVRGYYAAEAAGRRTAAQLAPPTQDNGYASDDDIPF